MRATVTATFLAMVLLRAEAPLANPAYAEGTPESCVPISFCSYNFGALTPQAEPQDYAPRFSYILDWPGVLINAAIRDDKGRGRVVPGFKSKVAGAGIWWYWLRVRAGGVGYAADAKVSLRDLAWDYSGLRGSGREPLAYWTGYQGHAPRYFGRKVDLDEPLSLADPDTVWNLARVFFHHEAGLPVTADILTRAEFEAGRVLAERRVK